MKKKPPRPPAPTPKAKPAKKAANLRAFKSAAEALKGSRMKNEAKPKHETAAPEPVEEKPASIYAKVKIADIQMSDRTQPRAAVDVNVVEEYRNDMQRGVEFPRIVLFFDSESRYWLADGFHRVLAAKGAEIDGSAVEKIDAEIFHGSQLDAEWYSVGANKGHGLRRTNADKQRAVEKALRHPEAAEKSNRQIAEHCGVDEGTIRNQRKKLTAEIPQSTKRTGRDGRTTETKDIGKRVPSEPAPPIAAAASTLAAAAPAPPVAPHLVPTSENTQPAALESERETERPEPETKPAVFKDETPLAAASTNLRDWARKISLDPVNDEALVRHIAGKYYGLEAEKTFREAAERLQRIADKLAAMMIIPKALKPGSAAHAN